MKVRAVDNETSRLLPAVRKTEVGQLTGPELETKRAAETRFLRSLWVSDRRSELVTRVVINDALGWRMGELADMIGVSRVTLNRLLDEYRGDYDLSSEIKATEALDFRTDVQKIRSFGYELRPDRTVVPPENVKTLQALWRVAYRSRGSSSGGDKTRYACVTDALDVYISLLMRRGVTNLAIAEAAGVTHRAVLDRMRRARARDGFLNEDETFFGDRDIIGLGFDYDGTYWGHGASGLAVLIATNPDSTKSPRSWLRVLQHTHGDVAGSPVVFTSGGSFRRPDPKLAHLSDDGLVAHSVVEDLATANDVGNVILSEFRTTLLMATFREQRHLAERARIGPRLAVVPLEYYYGQSAMEGLASEVRKPAFMPESIHRRFFEDCPEALLALSSPDVLLEEFAEIPRGRK